MNFKQFLNCSFFFHGCRGAMKQGNVRACTSDKQLRKNKYFFEPIEEASGAKCLNEVEKE
jgi:hypothetical protein